MQLIAQAIVTSLAFYFFAYLPFRVLTRKCGFEPAGVLVVLSFILTATVMILTN